MLSFLVDARHRGGADRPLQTNLRRKAFTGRRITSKSFAEDLEHTPIHKTVGLTHIAARQKCFNGPPIELCFECHEKP